MDIDKLTAAAVESFLHAGQRDADERPERKRRRLGGIGGVAVGVGLAVAGRAAYNRIRDLDLEQVASAFENRLKS